MKNSFFLLSLLIFIISNNLFSSEKQYQHEISIDGGIAVPFGEYSDINKLKTGYGFSTKYYFHFDKDNNFYFSASAGYYSFKGEFWNFPGYSNSLDVIPFQIGIMYDFKYSGIDPYIGFEAGIINMHSVSDMNTNGKTTINEYCFGMTPKLGIKYPIISNLDLDANIKLLYVIYKEIGIIQYYNHEQIGFNVGLTYTIGN